MATIKSIEEKAKAYDRALEAVKSLREGNPSDEGIQNWVNENFPELAESKDEMIRKEIIDYLKPMLEIASSIPTAIGRWINWLEAQGEQKPLGFNIGDGITVNGQICKVVAVEQKPAEWSRDDDQYLLICKNALYKYQVSDKWDANIIYQWLEDKVKSSVQQPKQEWSERDELMLGKCIDAASGYYSPEDKQPMKDWLKSLKERYTWKPSEGQLECLGYAIEKAEKDWSPLTNNRIYLTLKALKEQLLELRGSKV